MTGRPLVRLRGQREVLELTDATPLGVYTALVTGQAELVDAGDPNRATADPPPERDRPEP